MKTWPIKTMAEVTRLVTDGKHGDCDDAEDSGYFFLSSKDLRDGRLQYDKPREITYEGFIETHRRTNLEPGDILLANCGASIGRVGIAQDDPRIYKTTFQKSVSVIKANKAVVDNRFLYYFVAFKSSLLIRLGNGAAQPNLLIGDLKRIEVPVPPLPVQRRIAGILSAYDELMENSQRRIRLLEAMARALYREWFVHFRFPGHEKLPRVASPLGDIPQGWEVKRVPECVDISPHVTVPRDGEKPFVPMGCLSNDSMLITDIESREGNSGAKFQNDDTLFARITPCLENGKTGFVQFLPDAQAVAFGSTEFIVLRSRTLTPEFVYLLSRSDEFRGIAIKSMSGATGRQRVQEQCFDDFQIAQPPRALLDRFSAIVAPSFRLIYKLHLQIQNLRRTRDLLLPRLLSGQVELA
jgi:type I restriction enzyme S subunit